MIWRSLTYGCALTLIAMLAPRSGWAQQCSDSSACTVGDTCRNGACEGEPVLCSDDGDACTIEFCNPSTGNCSSIQRDCDDYDPCTTDSCDSQTGCVHTPVPDSPQTACDDGNECTVDDACVAGECVGTNSTASCNDENECTDNDVCSGGTCGGTPVNNGTSCNADDNECTQNDSCLAGFCIPGSPVICTPSGDPCAPASCNADTGSCQTTDINAICETLSGPCGGFSCQGGQCVGSTELDGEPCDDGNECTASDRCRAGVCQGSSRNLPPSAAPAMSGFLLGALVIALAFFATTRLRRTRS